MRVANRVSIEKKIRKALQTLKQPIKDAKRLKKELTKLELKIEEFNTRLNKLKAFNDAAAPNRLPRLGHSDMRKRKLQIVILLCVLACLILPEI